MVKKSSIIRRLNLFSGKNLSLIDINVIQAAYARRDANTIKTVFNKPNILDDTAIGYGRLTNQLVDMLANPEYIEQRVINSKFNIQLQSSNNPSANLKKNFRLIYGRRRRPSAPQQPSQPSPIPTMDIYKMLLDRPFLFYDNRTRFIQVEWRDATQPSIKSYFQSLNVNALNNVNINLARIYLKLKLANGDFQFVSSKLFSIGSIRYIENFLAQQNIRFLTNQITNGARYDIWDEMGGIVDVDVESIETIFVRFYKD